MATTTNYGWTTPDDTALVKDGASAIRTLGTAIDTTTFNNASAAIAKTIVDAKGDIIAATAADTVSRLAVGANDTVLTADSTAATGLKWATPAAGGMTLISTTTLSGATTTISSIPATYNDLYVIVRNVLPATDSANLRMRFNADATANRHAMKTYDNAAGVYTFDNDRIDVAISNDNATTQGLSYIYFPDYKNTTTWKMCNTFSIGTNATTTTSYNYRSLFGFYNQTGAISSLDFFLSSGNFTSGSVLLYGVK
jgi:hypothetical protein